MTMMTGLFSSFDPTSSFLSLNWFVLLFPVLILGHVFFMSSSAEIMLFYIFSLLFKEFCSTMAGSSRQESSKLVLSLFFSLFFLNFCGLIPSIFTSTSHISLSFPLAFSLWLSCVIFSFSKNLEISLSHLVPSGTPWPLMPLMVLIELVSMFIRPITLSVRLTANMVAGHILISLVENFILSGSSPLPISFISISVLTVLEIGVSLVQSYIFCTLLLMYLSENH